MPIVEYMLHAVEGSPIDNYRWKKKPDFVIEGGYFQKTDGTFLGYIFPANQRDYYVPDTLEVLTKEDVVQRAFALHAIKPYQKSVRIEDPSEQLILQVREEEVDNPNAWPMEQVDMNENEVRAMAEKFYDDMMAKYNET
jgi:hypothetical protein